jgi:hypothetical protein
VTARHYIRRPDTALVAAADRVAERIAATLDRQKAKSSSYAQLNERPSDAAAMDGGKSGGAMALPRAKPATLFQMHAS